MKTNPRSVKDLRVLFLLLNFFTVLLFTQCKKDEELKPGAQPSNSELSIMEVAPVYTIKLSEQIVDNATLKLAPGSVIKLESGSRGPLLIRNFVGTAAAPFIFINGSTATKITSGNSYGFKAEGCKNVRVTGSGGSDKYGIQVLSGHIGMTFEKLSSDIEVDRVEVANSGFAGIMAKTDPTCDPSTWRQNFTMRNIKLHDNYVHNVTGEGFYIGNSFYVSGRALTCGTIYPHSVENVEIYNNKVYSSGCEGIQVGSTIAGLKVHDNSVELFGQDPFASGQNNGIQFGEGSTGLLYNNVVKNGPGNALIILGTGNTKIYNNVIINPGTCGAFVDNRGTATGDVAFINNTFINPKGGGIKTFNEVVKNKFYNNIIVGTSNFFMYGSGATGDAQNNYTMATAPTSLFADAANGNYKLKSGSPAIDAGLNVLTYGVTFDMAGLARPYNLKYDIGAYEFGSTSTTTTPTSPTTSTGGTTSGGTTTTPTTGTTTPTTTTGPVVTSFTLVNADTDKDIMTIANGSTVSLSQIGTSKINIRANVTGTASVKFGYDANASYKTESTAPFAMFGDASGNYNAFTPTIATHTITATPYSGTSASGTKGASVTVSVNFVK